MHHRDYVPLLKVGGEKPKKQNGGGNEEGEKGKCAISSLMGKLLTWTYAATTSLRE